MIQVSVYEMESVFNRIIIQMKLLGVECFQAESDLYNLIPTSKWDITNKPEEVTVIGSLVDDMECIKELARDRERECTYVDFDRVATILRAISQKENPV